MIVIDLGCAPHGADISIEPLVRRFEPDVLYGFDPLLRERSVYHIGMTHIALEPKAAWTEDGFVGFHEAGIRSYVFEFEAGAVQCFDLARFIFELTPENAAEIVLKMDVEGGEYPLCRHLHETGADERLTLALMEWHEDATVALRCPVEEWDHLAVTS